MNIEEIIVRESDSLNTALTVLDRSPIGLALAVDAEGRLAGIVDAERIGARLAAGACASTPVSAAMTRAYGLPATAPSDMIQGQMNGIAVVPLLDAERRPVEIATPARPRRIPVAEPALTGNELKYVTECIATNWISSQGAFVRRFEEAFAARLGVPHALAVSNGTVALHLALEAFDIGAGDEVIVPDLTFAATINAVLYAGATPVIVDVDARSWNIDPAAIAAAITPRTRAIIPVHLYGQPADMDAIMALAGRHDLIVIEDAAEAVGAVHKGRPCGAIGHAGTFSFFSNKLVTTGEGGMVTFRDARAAEHGKILRDHGMDPAKRYWHNEVGYNYRLTNLQAAIGCAQLEQLDGFLARKLEIAAAYRERLSRVDGLTLPARIDGFANSHWMISVIADAAKCGMARDEILARLGKANIETRPLFYPLHDMPPYRAYVGGRDFPNATRLSANGFSLPSAVTLTAAEIDYVCGVLQRILGARRLVRGGGSA